MSASMWKLSRNAPPHHLKYGIVEMRKTDGLDVPGLGRARHHLFGNRARPIDLAKYPQNGGEVRGDGHANVLGKAKRFIAMVLRIENGKRAFNKRPRRGEIPGAPLSRAVEADSDDSFGRSGCVSTSRRTSSAILAAAPIRRARSGPPRDRSEPRSARRILGSAGKFPGCVKAWRVSGNAYPGA